MTPDPKPAARVRDPELLKRLHFRWRECALADESCERGLSLHHIHRHPRDDLEENLVMLCGDGVRGHHGRITAHEPQACAALRRHFRRARPDVTAYLGRKLGGPLAASQWLQGAL